MSTPPMSVLRQKLTSYLIGYEGDLDLADRDDLAALGSLDGEQFANRVIHEFELLKEAVRFSRDAAAKAIAERNTAETDAATPKKRIDDLFDWTNRLNARLCSIENIQPEHKFNEFYLRITGLERQVEYESKRSRSFLVRLVQWLWRGAD